MARRRGVKRDRGGRFREGSAGGPGRPAKMSDAWLAELAKDRPGYLELNTIIGDELTADELEGLMNRASPEGRRRIRRVLALCDLAELALLRRLAAAAGKPLPDDL